MTRKLEQGLTMLQLGDQELRADASSSTSQTT